MAASEENSSLFPIFILTMMALPLVPYTIVKLCNAAKKKAKSLHCQCAVCSRSGKYHKSLFKRVCDHCVICYTFLFILFRDMFILLWIASLPIFCILNFVDDVQISNFSTCSNLTLVLLWVIMAFLVYYIKNMSAEVRRFCDRNLLMFSANRKWFLLDFICSITIMSL